MYCFACGRGVTLRLPVHHRRQVAHGMRPRALLLVRRQPDLFPLQAKHQPGSVVARTPTFRMSQLQDWSNVSSGIDAVINEADKQRPWDAVAPGDESPALRRRGGELCGAGLNLQAWSRSPAELPAA